MSDEINQLRAENDKLRALLAKGGGACVYCGLPAADIAKCARGFPGCGRMDDIVAAEVATEVAVLAEECRALRAERDAAREALTNCADQFAFYASEHERAGKTEKAATNRAMEQIARKALGATDTKGNEP